MTSHIVRSLPKDAQHRIIAGRYRAEARAKGRGRRISASERRVWELEKIYRDRFGKLLPNDVDGRQALQIVAESLSLTKGATFEKLVGFIRARAPWAIEEAEALASAADQVAEWQDADELAWRIGLTQADHDRLYIRTIGFVGFNKCQRKALQKEKKKHRDTERRRARGAKPRAQYEAESISRARPWEKLGMSKATWYRHRKVERETSARPILFLNVNKRPLVSTRVCT